MRIRGHLPPRILRYAIVVTFVFSVALWLRSPEYYDPYLNNSGYRRTRPKTTPATVHGPIPLESRPAPQGSHPADTLVREAQAKFQDWLKRETTTLEDAAAAYRKRRGRHPPPGFDVWWKLATDRKAVMVEDFWDQIYHDLRPFWALEPAYIRREAADYDMTITVRNGTASADDGWFWTQIWLTLVQSIEKVLPDVDIPVNSMDEPRLVVPWEDINAYVATEAKGRKMVRPDKVVTEFQDLPKPNEVEWSREIVSKEWERNGPYWPIAIRGCPPDSAARNAPVQRDFDRRPVIQPEFSRPHARDGLVENSTLASHICHQPDLQGLHGFFIHPQTTSASKVLFPLFGGSKLGVNNEILLPQPVYWSDEVRFTGGSYHGPAWNKKIDGAVWRGVATGGHNLVSNWRGFQRHRFVAMNNATEVFFAETDTREPNNWDLPTLTEQTTHAQRDGQLANWIASWSDMGFTDLMCLENSDCAYSKPFYEILSGVDMGQQFEYKYLPDVDGNSFSGRFIGFLRSTSVPIKSTLFKEWADSRLLAWKHFVPMDSRYGDWYAIMEYFLGYDPRKVRDPSGNPIPDATGPAVEGHDDVAQRIAMDGKMWAEKVMRREDMQIYTLRLLLEYARVADDERDKMGWVGDLL